MYSFYQWLNYFSQIPAGNAHEVFLGARSAEQKLAWEFSVAQHGIEFEAHLHDAKKSQKPLVLVEKVRLL